MFFLWICLFIPNVPHSFQPIDVSHIQNFMVQRPFIKGCLRGDLQGRVLTFWGGLLIRCWHYMLWVYYLLYIWYITHIWIYIYIYICVCVCWSCVQKRKILGNQRWSHNSTSVEFQVLLGYRLCHIPFGSNGNCPWELRIFMGYSWVYNY